MPACVPTSPLDGHGCAAAKDEQLSLRTKCMFDTNIFNRVVDQDPPTPIERLATCVEVYATPIQWHEIRKTCNAERKANLCCLFRELVQDESHSNRLCRVISTETTAWGESPWGSGQWTKNGELYRAIRAAMGKRERDRNNPRDALIAETAIVHQLVLVTADGPLGEVARTFGAKCMSWEELREHCGV